MGLEQSNLIPMPQGFDYMAVTFRVSDRIRLIYPTQQDISIAREVLLQHWPKGIQEENAILGSAYEFKLKGNPFCKSFSTKEAIQSRVVAANLLFRFCNHGLKLLISSDLSQTTDLTTWIFHREETGYAQFGFASIGISSTDKLMFIGFPSALHEVLQHTVAQNWPKTIQKVKMIGDTLEIKLIGNPWLSEDGSESIQSRTLIKALINALDQQNWLLYGCSDLKETADTLFFRYDPNVPADGSRFIGFVISLSGNDRLQVIDAQPHIVNCVRNVLLQHWPHGIQREKQKFNADEFKLYGNPWWSDAQDGISARFVMCKLFEALMSIGWRVQIAIDLTRRLNDKSAFTFQQCLPITTPIFCLSLNYTDRIRFINAPQDVMQIVSDEIRKYWLFGIGKEGPCGTSREIKLNGNPWSYGATGHDGAHGRALLCHILKACASMGWFIIVSADVSAKYCKQDNGPDYPLDVHSWWFMQIPSAPQPIVTAPVAPGHFLYSEVGVNDGGRPSYDFSPNPPSYAELFK